MAEYFFGITDKGKRRDKNEDTFIAQEVYRKEYIAACVIDGVGGYSGGEVAAGIARAVILEHLMKLPGDIISILQEAITAANKKIFTEKQAGNKNENMACVLTCALADIKNNKFYYAHVGDTRLYLLRDNSLVKITKDHSVVGFLEESGRLSEEDAMRHPRRNEINKALGFEEQIHSSGDFIETGESPFLPGDTILLCSDGLTDMIGTNLITSILIKDLQLSAKGQELIDAANEAGGKDNITAVLVENNKKPRSEAASKPAVKKDEITEIQDVSTKSSEITSLNTGQKKNNNALVLFLTLLCLGLAFAFLFTLFKDSGKKEKIVLTTPPALKVINEHELQLRQGLNDTSGIYALSAPSGFITISDSLNIRSDTFHLLGNGITLRSDTNYKGPALIIDPAVKNIILDSVALENFDVGIITQKNNITFKNVRFINCRIPVLYQLTFKDSLVSGRLKDSLFIPNSPN